MWQNLKIVELASVLAGPLVGSFFSELGAKVIKVENKKTGGDVTRNWKLVSEESNSPISSYYASANYDKEVVFADLKNATDFKKVMILIKDADIVIQNFKAGAAKKLGLDAESLLKLKPTLIVGCINGFGENDSRPAFDVVLQAETGFMSMNGSSESGPIKMPVALIDVLAAHHLKEAILISLLEKNWTGKGKVINVSLYDAAIASLANQASNYLMAGHVPKPMGSRHPNIAPYGDIFTCKNGKQLVLAVGSDNQFKNLCHILKVNSSLIERFSSNTSRLKYRDELNEILQNKFKLEKCDIWKDRLLEGQIPFGVIKNLEEVFENVRAKKAIISSQIDGSSVKRIQTLLR